MALDPFRTHPLHDLAMQRGWRLIRRLLGGTQEMREAGQDLLPFYAEESDDDYRKRMLRVYVYPMFENAIERIVSKPFSKQVTVEGTEPLGPKWSDDVDRRGTDLHAFLRKHFIRKASYGVSTIVAAMPSTRGLSDENGHESVANIARFRIRPYLRCIHPTRTIAWEWKDGPGGLQVLGELRVLETRFEQDAEGGFVESEYVRRYLETGQWELYRRTRRGSHARPELVDSGALPVNYIPAIVDCADEDEDDPLAPYAPLEGLAWLNYRHTISWMEQNIALFGARAAMLFEQGADAVEARKPLVVGPFRTHRVSGTPDETDLKFVEPTGKGCELGDRDLANIIELARSLGDQPLMRTGSTQTAKGRALDEGKVECTAHSWVHGTTRNAARAIRMCAHLKANGAGELDDQLPNLKVDIYSDFAAFGDRGLDSYALVQKDHQDGVIGKRLRLEAGKRFGVYPDTIDIETELDIAEEEDADRFQRQAEMLQRGLPRTPGAEAEAEVDEEAEDGGSSPPEA